ncbi:phage tail sheath subtilisin-like domain-containing protein [Pseudochelatococcus sp. B33]
MNYNIGLNVIEVNGSGAPAIAGAATSVAAFNVLTRRGIPNQAARITSMADFVQRFGGHFAGGYGAYLVQGFFDNGGAVAYVNRVAGAGTTVASLQLADSAASPTLRIEAGYRGTADPGSWGRDIYVRTTRRSITTGVRLSETAPATITSAALPAATDLVAAGFPPLIVTIDNAPTPTQIDFAAGQFADPTAATREEIVAAINAGTDDLVASLTAADELQLTSTGNIALVQGGFTRLEVAANADLGFAAATAGDATTSALGATGATLADVSRLKVGDAVEFSDGATTEQVKLMSVNLTTRAVSWSPALAAPGAYTTTDLRIATLEFDIEIYQGGTQPEDQVEVREGLSMESDVANYAVAVLNDPLTGSTFVRGIDENSATGVGEDRPADLPLALALSTGGVDSAPTAPDFIGDAAAGTGFYAFDAFQVQIVTSERTDAAIAQAGITYCEGRDDAMYVGAVPENAIAGGSAIAYGQALMGMKRYGALYGPWIVVSDPLGVGDNPLKTIPPTGHVMGVYARIESTRGIWKAPAGDEAQVRGAIDVTTRFSDVDHTALVKEGAINGIRPMPRAGIVIDASRTLSTDSRWLFVNVRLLFNFVKSSLREGLRWVRQEPNKDRLWSLIKYDSVIPFLTQLWQQGAFGTGKPSEVFTVICDASNNPPAQVQLGFLNVDITFYPSVPAETIVVRVGQQPGGSSASEA